METFCMIPTIFKRRLMRGSTKELLGSLTINLMLRSSWAITILLGSLLRALYTLSRRYQELPELSNELHAYSIICFVCLGVTTIAVSDASCLRAQWSRT